MVIDDSFGGVKAPKLQADSISETSQNEVYRVRLSLRGGIPFHTRAQADEVRDLYAADSDCPETPLHFDAIKNDLTRQFAGQELRGDFCWNYETVPVDRGYVVVVTFGKQQAMEFAGYSFREVPMESSD